jgi:hypothetical protein
LCQFIAPLLERVQHKGTVHGGSKKSLTEAIYFPLAVKEASLHWSLYALHTSRGEGESKNGFIFQMRPFIMEQRDEDERGDC